MRVDVLDDLFRGRLPALAALAPVAVELEVGEVSPPPRERAHRLERRGGVARLAQVVAVDVHRVRQLERVRSVRERLEDTARRDGARAHRIVEPRDVAAARLPAL